MAMGRGGGRENVQEGGKEGEEKERGRMEGRTSWAL